MPSSQPSARQKSKAHKIAKSSKPQPRGFARINKYNNLTLPDGTHRRKSLSIIIFLISLLTQSFHKLKDSERAELEAGRKRFEEQLARAAQEESGGPGEMHAAEEEEDDQSEEGNLESVNAERIHQIEQQRTQQLEGNYGSNDAKSAPKGRKGGRRVEETQAGKNDSVDEDVRMNSPDHEDVSTKKQPKKRSENRDGAQSSFQRNNNPDHDKGSHDHRKNSRPSRYVKEQNEYKRIKAEREAHAAALREREQAAMRREREREQWRTAVNAKTRTGQVKLGKQSRLLLDKVKRQMAES